MRLEIPDTFDLAPLLTAIHQVAAQQQHYVSGEWCINDTVFTFRPRPQTQAERIAALGRKIDDELNFDLFPVETSRAAQRTSPGLVVIEQQPTETKVVSINQARAARGGCTPPRAA
jgi:hypothetical protein